MTLFQRVSLIAFALLLFGAWAVGSGVLGSAWHGLHDGAACANGATEHC